ncbi:SMI1/KNR4 family protein [Tenacibaculum xiamenense]|uniref:SMI1/KNR4 family protein n=1 Tax=Tenacibaculum xiamenense TaxID=1261553 RepID=UPI0038954ACF
MEKKIFSGFNFKDFWSDNEYSDEYPTDEIVLSIENELGYKLPISYIEFMRHQNGGAPTNDCYPTNEETSWAFDHIAISEIMAIGRSSEYSLCGELGSLFMIEEWGYPDTGIYICTCPSAGHDMVMLDYANLNKDGEPKVVHVDQEYDYKKTIIANNFETFIRGLVTSDNF